MQMVGLPDQRWKCLTRVLRPGVIEILPLRRRGKGLRRAIVTVRRRPVLLRKAGGGTKMPLTEGEKCQILEKEKATCAALHVFTTE
jgi:hypothetical protein